jgi:hypothetical protein
LSLLTKLASQVDPGSSHLPPRGAHRRAGKRRCDHRLQQDRRLPAR